MTAAITRNLIKRYYSAFNAQDTDTMLDCLGAGFVHDVSQGERRKGKKRFAEFLAHMHACYHEQVSAIAVMTSTDGSRAAGVYAVSDVGFPAGGVLALGELNQPQGVYAELDMELLARVRNTGEVQTYNHWPEQPGATVLPRVRTVSLM